MKILFRLVLLLAGLNFIPVSNNVLHADNPYILECRPCPAGCQQTQIDKCWTSCQGCNCDAGAQGNCDCPQQYYL